MRILSAYLVTNATIPGQNTGWHMPKNISKEKTKQYRFVAKRVANNSKIVVMPLKKLKAFCESDSVINQSFVSLTL